MTTSFTTFATATFATGNIVVVQSAENMVPGLPIVFSGTTFGNVTANATYYIGNITFGFPTSNITLTSLPGGAVYALADGSGNMIATFTQGGQQIIPTVPPGEPLNEAFDAINTNFDQIWAAGPVGSNIQIDQNTILTLNTNGNLVLNPNGIGNVVANAHVIPDQDRVRNLGAPLLRWNTVYAQNFVGNGGGISNITVSNISNGSTNITALANANITVTVSGNSNVAVFTPNGLLIEGTVSSSGNITAPTFIGNLVGNITGNIDAGGANTEVQFNDDNLLAGSPGFTFNKVSNAVGITGTLTAGDVLTGGAISAVGNVTANYYFGNGSQLTGIITSVSNVSNGNSKIDIASPGSNITVSVDGVSNTVVFTPNGITATGNISASYYFGNGSQLTGITADNVNADDLIGNTLSGNVLYSSLVSVGDLANLSVVGTATTGNLDTAGTISAAGNITGGNVLFGSGIVSGTGNIYANKIFANIQGNIDAAGNLYEVQFNTTGDQLGATANFTYDFDNNVFTVNNGNIIGGNILTAGRVSAIGNVYGSWFVGNVDAGNVISHGTVIANLGVYGDIYTTSIDSADSSAIVVTPDMILLSGLNVNQDITVGNIVIPSYGNITVGNVRITNLVDPILDQDAATKRYVDSAIGNVLPIITNQTITPDGSSLSYNLDQSTTAVGILVTINGISQTPDDSYTVSGNTITFAESLLTSDIVQIRYLSGTSTGGSGTNYANANVVAYGESGWAGNIIPAGNLVYNLGNSTNRWNDLYLSGNTIYLDNATIGANGVDVVFSGNITANVNGFSVGYLNIPQVAFTGNATLSATDAGKHYYSTLSTANVLTIANNTSVGWQVGTAITIVNRGIGNMTIAQGTGVSLYLAGNSTAGNRIVTSYGMATLLNVAANVWMINGTGVV